MKIDLIATKVFEKNWGALNDDKYRFIINEGGTGSGKTWALAQVFLLLLLTKRNNQITICRKTFPALRATAMKDYFRIMDSLGLYKDERHNKSDNIYKYRSNEVDFISVDEPIKVRSRRRNYLWVNEANELNREDFHQLNMRTENKIFMDYNPSHTHHWIYDELQKRDDCLIIHSTYKDNPYLPKELVKEIESYKNLDENYWRVYGLGIRSTSENIIFTNWNIGDIIDDEEDVIYGLDFGFTHPTVLLEIKIKEGRYYIREMLYQTGLTNQDLIAKIEQLGVIKSKYMFADSEDKNRIEEIYHNGYNIYPSNKSVKDGIDFVKRHKLVIDKNSVNTIKELKNYSWKVDKNGNILEEPVKVADHGMDALRYALYSHTKINKVRVSVL